MNIFNTLNDTVWYENLKPILGPLLPSEKALERYVRSCRHEFPDVSWFNHPVPFNGLNCYSNIKVNITKNLYDTVSSIHYTSCLQGVEWAFNCFGSLQADNSLLFDRVMYTKCTPYSATSTPEMANEVYNHLYNNPSGVVMLGHTHPNVEDGDISIADIIAAVAHTNYLRSLPARHNAPIYVLKTMVSQNLFHMYFYDPMSNQVYRI